ncbi:hypothetical protein B0H13DRAFT_1993826, partial [Mycena leptocephala]
MSITEYGEYQLYGLLQVRFSPLAFIYFVCFSIVFISSFLLSLRFSLPFPSHLSPFHSRFPSSSHSSFFPFPLLSPIYLSLPLPLSLISLPSSLSFLI